MAKGPKPKPPEERFWKHVNKTETCWLWTGATNGRYGKFAARTSRADPLTVFAHRFSYELAHGPIPDGLVVNHRCEVRLCVNPAHLEAVTVSENLRYGTNPIAILARKTHCKHGHLLDRVRANGTRRCSTCGREKMRRRRERVRHENDGGDS